MPVLDGTTVAPCTSMNYRLEFDYTRNLSYYYDTSRNKYVYTNGMEIAGQEWSAGSGRNEAIPRASSTASDRTIRGRTPSGAESDQSLASAFTNISSSSYSATSGSSSTSAPIYHDGPQFTRFTPTGSYTSPNHGYNPPYRVAFAQSGYGQRPPRGTQYQALHQSHKQSAYGSYQPPVAYCNEFPAQTSYEGTVSRPSDEELLRNTGREVVFRPEIQDSPPELARYDIVPHRIFRGSLHTHGTQERLNPSFQIQTPGDHFYRRGVVFRVLWPELAGDMRQDITIVTTKAFGENIFYKIRWFVVVREGHNCCTCLSIQTYGGRGVPNNKPKSHHAIMYTGQYEPQPIHSEMVTDEPPMGQSVRVIGHKPYAKMDTLSRVNFLKLYTVEHNVKVEYFGFVDPNDEWKLIAQFNSHWGILGNEALPPATWPTYYDGQTHGPAPSTCGPASDSYATTPSAYTSSHNSYGYEASNYEPPSSTLAHAPSSLAAEYAESDIAPTVDPLYTTDSTNHRTDPMLPIDGYATSDFPTPDTGLITHALHDDPNCNNETAIEDGTYDDQSRPFRERRSSSYRANRSQGGRRPQ